jgi:Zn-finger nucleic acid-binding protein
MMTPRFKGKPNFDFSLPCPLCGYRIQPNELMRLASHIIQCPKCGGVFDEMAGRKLISTS